MPTGYTADIAKGITFNSFAWSCARAFGALIMMRDSASDAPIPERFEPSDWNAKELANAKDRLATLQVMSRDDAAANAKAEYDAAVKSHRERLAEKQDLSDKYYAMLAEAVKWEPPTPEHQGLKDFMVEQIHQSIDWDCSTKYMEAPLLLPTEAWLETQIAKAKHDVEYHEHQHAEEVERAEGRNALARGPARQHPAACKLSTHLWRVRHARQDVFAATR
jgi:hypothetical protein